MSLNSMDEYWVPEHVKEYLRGLGFVLPLDDMEPWIRSWDDWMGARGDFYDYRDKDGLGRVYEVHRRSIHPAMRVCKEWGSLLLNEDVKVVWSCGRSGSELVPGHCGWTSTGRRYVSVTTTRGW